MKKIVFILFSMPLLVFSQEGQVSAGNKIKKLETSMQNAANRAMSQQAFPQEKTIKQVLDSVVFDEYYTNPSEYLKYYKYQFIYNENGLNEAQYLWIYDEQEDTLGKIINTYNNQHQLETSILYTNWGGTGWIIDSKNTSFYDANGFLVQQIDSNYSNNAYEIYLTLNFTYDANNRISEIMGILADDGTTIYGDQKIIFEYNTDGTLQSNLLQWEDIGFPTYSDKRYYTFDYAGSNSSVTHKEEANFQTQVMEASGTITKFYNTEYMRSDLVLPTGALYKDVFIMMPEELIGSYSNRLDSLQTFGANTELEGRMRYYYAGKDILGLGENQEAQDFVLYPNPTSGKIKLGEPAGNYTVELFDLCGKKILQAENAKEIDLSSFAGGIYHLQIKNDKGQLSSQKISLNK